MERPRAWTAQAVRRRISLALLCGSLLKAIAAACAALPMGPWDRKAASSAGRLANHLDLHAQHFAALALQGVAPRKYRKIAKAKHTKDLPPPNRLRSVVEKPFVMVGRAEQYRIVYVFTFTCLNVYMLYDKKIRMLQQQGDKPKVRRMTVLLPEELYKRLRHASADMDLTMSEIIADALTKHLEKGSKRKAE